MDFPKTFFALPNDVAELTSIINRTWTAEVGGNRSTTEIQNDLVKLLSLSMIERLDTTAGRATDLRTKLSPKEYEEIRAYLDSLIEYPRSWSTMNDAWGSISRKLIRIRSFRPRVPSSSLPLSPTTNKRSLLSTSFKRLIIGTRHDRICFVLPLAELLRSYSNVQYAFDPSALLSINGTSGKIARLAVTFANEPSNEIILESPTQLVEHSTAAIGAAHGAISISNVGVFDKKNFPPCSNTHINEYDCFDWITRSAIEKSCGCRLFSGMIKERRFGNINAEQMQQTGRYCTSKIYGGHCRSKAENEIKTRIHEAKMSGSCEPCTKIRNVYHHDVRYFDDDILPHLFTLRFQSNDADYVLYTDVHKFTVWHIVSEAGGALGMAIGFSLLGIIQWFASCYELYQWDVVRRNREIGRNQDVLQKQFRPSNHD